MRLKRTIFYTNYNFKAQHMAEVIRMPKMSDTMVEGVISSWLKKVGDKVKSGDILAEVETDKATMELEAYEEGTLLYVGVAEKQSVPVNGIMAIIGEPNEDIAALLSQVDAEKTTPDIATTPDAATSTEEKAQASPKPSPTTSINTAVDSPSHAAVTADKRIAASPLAKKMAQEKGYDLSNIVGTGEGGRITKRDIEHKATQMPAVTQPYMASLSALEENYQLLPASPMRQTIAKRLTASATTIPHFYLTSAINMDAVVEARTKLTDYAEVKVTFNDIIIKALAAAIRKHPTINTAWVDNTIRLNHHIHLGVAMAIENGLIVPVIRFADHQSIAQIAVAVKDLAQRAKDNQLQPKDLEGCTFTISNLGMFGIESFTAIINPPGACILAIGAIQQVPVIKDNVVVPAHVMKVTLSCDHRVVDGAVGAAFLKTLKELLEEPLKLLV